MNNNTLLILHTPHLALIGLILFCFCGTIKAQEFQEAIPKPGWRFYQSAGFSIPSLSSRIAKQMDARDFGDTECSFGIVFFIPVGSSTDSPQKDGINGFLETGVDCRLDRSWCLSMRLGLDPSASVVGFRKIGSGDSGSIFFPILYTSSDHGHFVKRSQSTEYFSLIYTHRGSRWIHFSFGPILDFNKVGNGNIDQMKWKKSRSMVARIGLSIQFNSWNGTTADWWCKQQITYDLIRAQFKNSNVLEVTGHFPMGTFPAHCFRTGIHCHATGRTEQLSKTS